MQMISKKIKLIILVWLGMLMSVVTLYAGETTTSNGSRIQYEISSIEISSNNMIVKGWMYKVNEHHDGNQTYTLRFKSGGTYLSQTYKDDNTYNINHTDMQYATGEDVKYQYPGVGFKFTVPISDLSNSGYANINMELSMKKGNTTYTVTCIYIDSVSTINNDQYTISFGSSAKSNSLTVTTTMSFARTGPGSNYNYFETPNKNPSYFQVGDVYNSEYVSGKEFGTEGVGGFNSSWFRVRIANGFSWIGYKNRVRPPHYANLGISNNYVYLCSGFARFSSNAFTINITAKKYKLDINGNLDGKNSGSTSGMGTFDVYVNNKRVANDVTDFYQDIKYGSNVVIKGIKANTGKHYVKCDSTTSFTLTAATSRRLYYETNKLTINYYSNSATSGTVSSTAISGLGEGKQVKIKSAEFKYANAYSSGLGNYTNSSSTYFYLARTGYTGTGYWATSNGSYKVHQDTSFNSGQDLAKALGVDISKSNKTVNVYAQWTPNRHILDINTFVDGVESFNSSDITTFDIYRDGVKISTGVSDAYWYVYYDTVYEVKNIVAKQGYVYSGSGKDITKKTIKGDTDIELNFTIQKYTIQFNGNGATGGSTPSMSMSYNVSKNLSSNGYYRTGYKFSGWNTKADGSGDRYSNLQSVKNLTLTHNAVITLYAQWTPNTYYITYNGNGANSGYVSKSTMTYDILGYINYNSFSRDGYTFVGWNTREDGNGIDYRPGQVVKNLTSVSGGVINLYAQWKENYVIVAYHSGYADKGVYSSLSGDKDVVVRTEKYYANSIYYGGLIDYSYQGAVGYLGRTGYKTNGQYEIRYRHSANISESQSFTGQELGLMVGLNPSIDGSVIEAYPIWEEISYTIKFNGNGSTSGNMKPIGMKYTSVINLPYNSYSKTGYTFKNWNTKANGSGTSYSNGQSVSKLTTIDGDILNLYAQWNPNRYSIVFHSNDGTGQEVTMEMTYDVSKNLIDTFRNAGYNFIEWNTKADGSGTGYAENESVKNLTSINNGVVHLYAQWESAISMDPIEPNAAYRENTYVVSGFWINNESDRWDILPSDNLDVYIKILDSDGSSLVEQLKANIVIPKEDKNMVYIKWLVPTGLNGRNIRIIVTNTDPRGNEVLVDKYYSTCAYNYENTPNTKFEYSKPSGFVTPSVPANVMQKASWWEYKYSNGKFVKKEYKIELQSGYNVRIAPVDASSAYKDNGVWVMKSGYGFTLLDGPAYSLGINTSEVPSESYTSPQYFYLTYPEYNYKVGSNTITTLINNGRELPDLDGLGSVHFTPIWYPDGYYIVQKVCSDCWTPMGMLTSKVRSSSTIKIEGSMYDDWYIS